MTAGESAKAEPTLKEVIEGLKIHLEVAHEYHTPSGSMERGCDHEEEIKSAITALEASSPPTAERTALKELRKKVEALRIDYMAAFAYQGPPSAHWIDTKGKEWEAHNKAIDKVLAEIDAQETKE